MSKSKRPYILKIEIVEPLTENSDMVHFHIGDALQVDACIISLIEYCNEKLPKGQIADYSLYDPAGYLLEGGRLAGKAE